MKYLFTKKSIYQYVVDLAKLIHSGKFTALRYLYHKRRKVNMNELNNLIQIIEKGQKKNLE